MPFQKGHEHYPKRKVNDDALQDQFLVREPDFIKNLVASIKEIQWPYAKDSVNEGLTKEQQEELRKLRLNRRALLQSRDQALAALLVLIGPRISEALAMQRKLFIVRSDRIEVKSFLPGKKGNLRKGLFLPLNPKALLYPVTQIFLEWFQHVDDDPESYIFPTAKPFGILRWNTPMERSRAHWIFNSTIGTFPHLYRGICETVYGKLVFNSEPFKLKDFMGVRRIESTYAYVGEPFERDLERANSGS